MNDKKSIVISRIFNAPKELVWRAWTEPELIKKWWGPEHFTAPDIQVDLRVGGKYIFCMRGPAGTEYDKDFYSAGIYKEIEPMKKLVVSDYFSDKDGNKVNPASMGMDANFPEDLDVTVLFEDIGAGKTKLTIEYPEPATAAQFEAMKKSGMEEGWSTSLNKLEAAIK